MGLPAIRLHWQVLRLSILVNALFLFAYLYGSTLMLDQTDDELRPSVRRDLAWAGQRRGPAQVVQQIPTLQSQSQLQAQAQCSMCDVAPELCAEIGQDRMQQALSYGGTNARLKRALAKMRSGEPWVMGVIGGSVSTGHGIDWGTDDTPPINPKYRQHNMHRLIFDHLDSKYPSASPAISKAVALAEQRKAENANMVAPAADYAAWEGAINQDLSALPHGVGSRAYGFSGRKMGVNSLVNGASPGTGSDYFGYCFLEHIPEDVDVIVIELGINDQAVTWTFEHYERMLRALLDLPSKPAIIYAEAFALAFDTMHVGADIHKGLNQYYDIPSISLRNPFLGQALSNTTFVEQMFGGKVEKAGTLEGLDLRHISQYGHTKMAELVSAYVDSVDCGMRASEPADVALLDRYPQTDIPRIRLTGKYDASSHLEPARPTCQSMTAVVNKLVPSKNEGWSEWNWEEKIYLVAKKPGSKVSFDFTTAFGEVNLSYLRSREFGLGNIHCQVEGLGPEASMHIEGYWQLEFNILQTSSIKGFAPGTYTLTCELWDESADPAGGREFRIASLTR